MSDNNDGSFLNGFTVGLLAGAVGYFLFGTDKGTDVRQQLAAEWEKARGELEKDGILEKGKSLRDLVTTAVDKISDSAKTKPQVKIKTLKAKTSAKKKFKGT